MSSLHPVALMEKRIDNAMSARDHCKPGSWGDNYWSGVVLYLLRQMNRYMGDRQAEVEREVDRRSLH